MITTAIPQGDITFFPYDATVVVVGYLAGYFTFVSLFAPRLVLTLRARARLASFGSAATATAATPSGTKFKALTRLAGAAPAVFVGAPPASEIALALVQFTLLALFLYYLGRGHLQGSYSRVAPPVGGSLQAPSFGAVTTVTTNLVGLWLTHRDTLFIQPATYALFQTTHRALQLLSRGAPPAVLPRLLAVVRASKGIQSV